jgi:formamidopyrimidine-DNA glycosylase
MPESPEVQALAEFLAERAAGRSIVDADVLEFRTVKTRTTPPSALVGRTIARAERHGKHVALALDDGRFLVISLGRHGWVRWVPASTESADVAPAALPDDAPPALAVFHLDDGAAVEVTDAGTWVSLGLSVVGSPGEVAAIAKLGPDPADPAFSRDDFDRALGGRRKQVKAILQEQESLAGIGNAYSDEILHTAQVSPVTHAAALDDDARTRLFEATIGVIRSAIEAQRGVPIDELKAAKVASMRVHGRAGATCPVCGDTVRDFAFASTTAQYCPTCQTGGAVL